VSAQVSFEFASILQTLGFTCNSMGGETRLDIATYNFTGAQKHKSHTSQQQIQCQHVLDC
jgi:lysylphosphatidylglycerol synthetase-like protein (DUF2156 family)